MLHLESRTKVKLAVCVCALFVATAAPAFSQSSGLPIIPVDPDPPLPPEIEVVPAIVDPVPLEFLGLSFVRACGTQGCSQEIAANPIDRGDEPEEPEPNAFAGPGSNTGAVMRADFALSTHSTIGMAKSGGLRSSTYAPSSGVGILRNTEREDLLDGLRDAQKDLGL